MPDVRVEDEAGVERVLIGNIGTDDTPNYGLRVTSSDGTTVIIDGTSDVFKIQATGTISVTCLNNADTIVLVTLSSLGTLSSTPAFIGLVGEGVSTSPTWSGAGFYMQPWMFVAATSGGAVTMRVPGVQLLSQMFCYLSSSQVTVSAEITNAWGSTVTHIDRYYILTETAI